MKRLVMAVLAGVVMTSSIATAGPVAGREPSSGRVGVLLVDHGEPPIYNRHTYESFRKFFDHLIEMGLVPAWLRYLDTGTIVQPEDCYGCEGSSGPYLDAWLDPHEGPAAFVPASDSIPGHYVLPGGPGLGEPDIFEHVGLGAWDEWQIMGGRSPNYDQKLVKKNAVIRRLRARYGSGLPIRTGYGIDPRLNGAYQGIEQALRGLVKKDEVSKIVVAYHGVGFSDIMQTHMLRHEIHAVLEELGAEVDLVYTRPIGTRPIYVDAIVREVAAELRRVPSRAAVAIHLSGHGLATSTCGEYECGEDAYHRYSRDLFRRVAAQIERNIRFGGRLGVFHLYGEGATDEDDPDDLVDSPIEALDKRKEQGFGYVIDIPHEFDSDSRDTLIILRRGYQREIPDWNAQRESRFTYKDMKVKISNSAFGVESKTRAYYQVIVRALGGVS